jgi:hypothetical protein
MKYGVQISTTTDGSWSISQLVQRQPNGEYTRIQGRVAFIDYSSPNAAARLLDAIDSGLKGKLRRPRLNKNA